MPRKTMGLRHCLYIFACFASGASGAELSSALITDSMVCLQSFHFRSVIRLLGKQRCGKNDTECDCQTGNKMRGHHDSFDELIRRLTT